MKWNIEEIVCDLNYLVKKYKAKDYESKYKIIDGISMIVLMLESLDEKKLSQKFDYNIILRIKKMLKRINMINIDDDNNGYQLEQDNLQLDLLVKVKNIDIDYFSGVTFFNYSRYNFIKLIKEFFKNIDINLYNIFCKQLNNNKILIVKDKEYKYPYIGRFFTINELKKCYIICPYDKYLNYLVGIVHEFSHMLNTISIDYQIIDDSYWDYIEVISHFMELIFKDYLRERKIISNKDYYSNNMAYVYHTKYRADKIYDYILIDKIIKETGKNKVKDIQVILKNDNINFYQRYIREVLKYPAAIEKIYISNFLIAIQLFLKYKDNKRDISLILKKISISKSKEDLLNLNISLDSENLYNGLIEYIDFLKQYND